MAATKKPALGRMSATRTKTAKRKAAVKKGIKSSIRLTIGTGQY